MHNKSDRNGIAKTSSVLFSNQKHCLLSFVCFCFLSAGSVLSQSNEGTDFWFAFMEHRNPGQNTKVVMISSRENTSGFISSPLSGFRQSFSVRANEVTLIELPVYAETIGSEKRGTNGFRVESTDPVSVYIHQYHEFRSEATVVLPKTTIGNSYYSLSYTGYESQGMIFPSEFLIVASEDNTAFTIQLSANTRGGRSKGDLISILLNAGETYQIQGATAKDDMSGSYIEADKNFSLFCGNTYSALNCLRSGRDNLLEQSYPIDTWGTQFVAAPFQRDIKDVYRVLASEDNTHVKITANNGREIEFGLDAGEFEEFEDARLLLIESNNPIIVAQFMTQLDCGNGRNGDPSMLYLNTVLQIRDTVTLYNSSFQNIEENYINIICRSADVDELYFDGLPLSSSNAFIEYTGMDSAFASATLRVQAGAHTIYSRGCGVIAKAFGLGLYESYAYSGGASFNKINASPIPDGGCLSDTIFFNTQLPVERYEALWVFDNGDSIREHSFTRSYDELGVYPVVLFLYDRCFNRRDTLHKELLVSLRQAVEAAPDRTLCEGEDLVLGASDVAGAHYEWRGPLAYYSEEQFPAILEIEQEQEGIYEVIGNVSGCASYPAYIEIDVRALPQPELGEDSFFCPKSESLPLLSPGIFNSYLWSDGSSMARLEVHAAESYHVTVWDEFGCQSTDSISFELRCPTVFYIPNIFSPNGDLVNDDFGLEGEDIVDFDLRVFDTWGNEVFQSSDLQYRWQGLIENRPATTGIYTWVLALSGYDENGMNFTKSVHGTLSLVR